MTELDRNYDAGRRDMRAEILAAIEARREKAQIGALHAEEESAESARLADAAKLLHALARAIEVMP